VSRKTRASTDCPCCGQKLPPLTFTVDDSFRVIMRHGKAVALSFGQYAVFRALYRKRMPLTLNEIVQEVYRGGAAPLCANQSVHVMIRCLNKIIAHVQLRVQASHPGPGSTWRIQEL